MSALTDQRGPRERRGTRETLVAGEKGAFVEIWEYQASRALQEPM
jgi:hypothetical protein